MTVELKDIEHLAGLARIAISDDEKKILQHDLGEILAYVSTIMEVAAELGASEAGELRNVMREDGEPHESGIFTECILSQVPARDGDRLLVKKIL